MFRFLPTIHRHGQGWHFHLARNACKDKMGGKKGGKKK